MNPLKSIHWKAVVTLVLVHQAVGMAWYAIFGETWMHALGHTHETLQSGGSSPYFVGLLASFVTVAFLSYLLMLGEVATAGAGALWGLALFAFVMLPYGAMHNSFALVPWTVTLIDAGHGLAGAVIAGAVLGAWRPSAQRSARPALLAR